MLSCDSSCCLSVHMFVQTSVTFVEFVSKFGVKVFRQSFILLVFFLLLFYLYGIIQFKQQVLCRVDSLSVISECRIHQPGEYMPLRALFSSLFLMNYNLESYDLHIADKVDYF